MPEARRHRVSSQRFLPAFRLVAVALIAVYTTAFLWPEAQAAKKHEAPVAKKSQAAADSRASGTKNVAQSRGSGRASVSDLSFARLPFWPRERSL